MKLPTKLVTPFKHIFGLIKVAVPAAVGFAAANPGIVPPQYSAAAGLLIAGYTALHTQDKLNAKRGIPSFAQRIGIKFTIWFPRVFKQPEPQQQEFTTLKIDTGFITVVGAGLTQVDPKAYNGWRGECPGCDVDMRTLANFIEQAPGKQKVPPMLLTNKTATIKNFTESIVRAGQLLDPDKDILVVYNSCHGGQLVDENGDESDGKDETICLWDGQLSDDKISETLAKLPENLRVLFVSDSCHSGTNTRSMQNPLPVARPVVSYTGRQRILHFAGCSDKNFSYGCAGGGVFTNALVRSYKRGMTYREWFYAAAATMPANQHPVMTTDGTDFSNEIAF